MRRIRKQLRGIVNLPLKLPYLFVFIFSSEIGAHYGVGPVQKVRLILTFRRNSRRVETLSVIAEHLELAATLLRLPPSAEGAVVECGCYKGGCTINLSLVCEIVGRKLIVCDSFQGLPEIREHDAKHVAPQHARKGNADPYEMGDFAVPLEVVKGHVERYGAIGACEFKVGYFEESMQDFDEKVAMAFLDVDLIESLRPCLTAIWPGLVSDGRVYVHEADDLRLVATFFDEGWWGEKVGGAAPGFVGAGSGLPLAALLGSALGYAEKSEAEVYGAAG